MIEELLRTMEDYALEHKVPIINARGREVFLAALNKFQPQKVLEVGTAIGYSALLTCHTCPDVKIKSLELDPERIKVAQAFIAQSPYKEQIEIHQGDAAELLAQLTEDEQYDLVFIDAAKGQYLKYFNLVLPHLNNQGVIIADNVLFRDYVLGDTPVPRRFKTIVKRLREYIAVVSDTDKYSTTIYEKGDGLAITQLKEGAK